jgi:uncharacterized SAM-binding protein YcdF (DUF218 family)
MFVFLSKLLPLLFYPIGLSSLFTIVAIVLLKKRPWVARSLLITAVLVLWLSSTELVANQIAYSLERQNPPQDLPKASAIVVLGGATQPPVPPRTWPEVNEAGDRVIYGARLYRDGKAPKVILSGGRIQWRGQEPPEADDMATLLELMGVPKSAIVLEPNSLNTRENAVNVQQILQQQGIKDFLLVTSAIHMPRSLMIFRKLGMNPTPAPTDFLVTRQSLRLPTPEIKLLSLLPKSEELKRTNDALKEYVGIAVYRLKGWA